MSISAIAGRALRMASTAATPSFAITTSQPQSRSASFSTAVIAGLSSATTTTRSIARGTLAIQRAACKSRLPPSRLLGGVRDRIAAASGRKQVSYDKGIERFRQVVIETGRFGLAMVIRLAEPGDRDEENPIAVAARTQAARHFQSVNPWHLQIDEHDL